MCKSGPTSLVAWPGIEPTTLENYKANALLTPTVTRPFTLNYLALLTVNLTSLGVFFFFCFLFVVVLISGNGANEFEEIGREEINQSGARTGLFVRYDWLIFLLF